MPPKFPADLVHVELTDVESKLRQLLIDVAAYIDGTVVEKGRNGIRMSEDLAKEKVVLRWTGGWVRDKLLQVESHDIDVAINNMTGEHFGLKMQDYLQIAGNADKYRLAGQSDRPDGRGKTKSMASGLHKIEANPEKSKNLETATTRILGLDLDLVNLRKETYNELSRNPQMEFGTAEEDAMRRDATVNAMFYNLHTCQVEDLTGKGFEDMAAKIIRTPMAPHQTFKDDPLRVLRLIRFASRLDYTIEPETAKAMADPEIQNVLKVKISRERVGIELEKMLRGPRARMALELIDRLGLYSTVFTDPTRSLPAEPDTTSFSEAYDFVESIVCRQKDVPAVLADTLVRNEDEKYLAWICAALVPWADAPTVPNAKPTQRPYHVAYLVAREGFKGPNKVCDVTHACLANGPEIRRLVSQCAQGLKRPDPANFSNPSTARDTLGMAIRRWGSTWRTQVLFSLLYETVQNGEAKTNIMRSYAAFLSHAIQLEILEADTFKPLLKGTELAQALGTKPGPWMKEALDVVMAWQLRNPRATDRVKAIEAVKQSREEKREREEKKEEEEDSELPSYLASHFLELTIPPLFPQNQSTLDSLEASRQPAPWKEAAHQPTLGLLKWSIEVLRGREVEAKWRFLVPPVLRMMDDMEVKWKAQGCDLLGLLLRKLQTEPLEEQRGGKTGSFLQRTGYHNVFAEALFPLFTYLPSLTAEAEATLLLDKALVAVLMLALLLPTEKDRARDRGVFLDRILRAGIIAPLGHLVMPLQYNELVTMLLSHLARLLPYMGIESVKHLGSLIPLLSGMLAEPFALSDAGLVLSALHAEQALMLQAWPRLVQYRGEMMMGLCLLWGRCIGAGGTAGEQHVGKVKAEVQETVAMLDAVLQAAEDEQVKSLWMEEKQAVGQAANGFAPLFDKCGEM